MNDALRPRILTLHSDPLIRAGIVTSLGQHAAFDILEEDPDAAGRDADPIDVVIADYPQAMRLTDAAVLAARPSLATARILVLTFNDREADIRRAVEAGIHGYVLLGGPLSELVESVTTLLQGARYLGRTVAQRMADSLGHTPLTSREGDVLRLVVAGDSNKVIARRLQVEIGTVKSHLRAIMAKLDVTSRTQAAAIAIHRGLVEERVPITPGPTPPRVARLDMPARI